MRRWGIVIALALCALRAEAQETTEPRNLAVRVITELERVPLGYSVVAAPELALERFTGASGAPLTNRRIRMSSASVSASAPGASA